MISSEMPSLKYSFSGSGLMLANGSTAMEGASSAAAARTRPRAVPTSEMVWNRALGCFARQRRIILSFLKMS
jgi:hypothetical protein